MPRVFCATVDAALNLLPQFDVEEDQKYVHDRVTSFDMTRPSVIEIVYTTQNNRNLHARDTWFLLRAAESVQLHHVELPADYQSRLDATAAERKAVDDELAELRDYRAKREEDDAKAAEALAAKSKAAKAPKPRADPGQDQSEDKPDEKS